MDLTIMTQLYKECQEKLLQEEINVKKTTLKTAQHEYGLIYANLKSTLSYFDLGHMNTIGNNSNEKSIKRAEITQNN